MDLFKKKLLKKRSQGVEMVEMAIIIAIIVGIGLIFKSQLTAFVNKIFGDLINAGF